MFQWERNMYQRLTNGAMMEIHHNGYYLYYMYVKMTVLNHFRRERGLNTFVLVPIVAKPVLFSI